MNQSDDNEFSDPRAGIKKCGVVVAVIALCSMAIGAVLLLGRTMDGFFSFEKNRTNAEAQIAKLRDEIAQLDKEKDKALRLIEAEKARQRGRLHEQYTNEAARIRVELGERRRELKSVQSELDSLRNEWQVAQSRHSEGLQLLEDYRSTTNSLAIERAQLLRVQAEAARWNDLEKQISEARAKLESLKDEVKKFERKRDDAKESLRVAEDSTLDERRIRDSLVEEVAKLGVRRAVLEQEVIEQSNKWERIKVEMNQRSDDEDMSDTSASQEELDQ